MKRFIQKILGLGPCWHSNKHYYVYKSRYNFNGVLLFAECRKCGWVYVYE